VSRLAWLLVQCLRNLGIAARFVSGYLIQLAVEGSPDGPKTDSAELHAWAEAFLPGAGWIGLDPTSGLLTSEGHIPLVCTPQAAQAAPIAGTSEPAGTDLSYSISVRRMNDPRRLSKPFSETEWAAVRQVAYRIDADLKANDVRLTMGGEPTYVGIDDPESPQWNIAAAGGNEANARVGDDPRAAQTDRAGRAAALRTGEVVSGRGFAAVGTELLLACRWRSGVGQ
jgi:hypothetical protein